MSMVPIEVDSAGSGPRESGRCPFYREWNLADVYPSQATWKAQKEKITAEISRLAEFRGKLGSSPAVLADALEMSSRLDKDCPACTVYTGACCPTKIRASPARRV